MVCMIYYVDIGPYRHSSRGISIFQSLELSSPFRFPFDWANSCSGAMFADGTERLINGSCTAHQVHVVPGKRR